MGRDRIDRLNLPTPPSLFVSYSRAQLAIAESLAVSAAANGIAVWFDLLALTPGLDWQLAIDAGLDAATWVALVVSRESLASPNVAREVERALSSGKPLYLLVVDDCPLRLRHVPGCNLEVEARGIIDSHVQGLPAEPLPPGAPAALAGHRARIDLRSVRARVRRIRLERPRREGRSRRGPRLGRRHRHRQRVNDHLVGEAGHAGAFGEL